MSLQSNKNKTLASIHARVHSTMSDYDLSCSGDVK